MPIARRAILDGIRVALDRSPVVVLTGPRQCGYFDLEDPVSLATPGGRGGGARGARR